MGSEMRPRRSAASRAKDAVLANLLYFGQSRNPVEQAGTNPGIPAGGLRARTKPKRGSSARGPGRRQTPARVSGAQAVGDVSDHAAHVSGNDPPSTATPVSRQHKSPAATPTPPPTTLRSGRLILRAGDCPVPATARLGSPNPGSRPRYPRPAHAHPGTAGVGPASPAGQVLSAARLDATPAWATRGGKVVRGRVASAAQERRSAAVRADPGTASPRGDMPVARDVSDPGDATVPAPVAPAHQVGTVQRAGLACQPGDAAEGAAGVGGEARQRKRSEGRAKRRREEMAAGQGCVPRDAAAPAAVAVPEDSGTTEAGVFEELQSDSDDSDYDPGSTGTTPPPAKRRRSTAGPQGTHGTSVRGKTGRASRQGAAATLRGGRRTAAFDRNPATVGEAAREDRRGGVARESLADASMGRLFGGEDAGQRRARATAGPAGERLATPFCATPFTPRARATSEGPAAEGGRRPSVAAHGEASRAPPPRGKGAPSTGTGAMTGALLAGTTPPPRAVGERVESVHGPPEGRAASGLGSAPDTDVVHGPREREGEASSKEADDWDVFTVRRGRRGRLEASPASGGGAPRGVPRATPGTAVGEADGAGDAGEGRAAHVLPCTGRASVARGCSPVTPSEALRSARGAVGDPFDAEEEGLPATQECFDESYPAFTPRHPSTALANAFVAADPMPPHPRQEASGGRPLQATATRAGTLSGPASPSAAHSRHGADALGLRGAKVGQDASTHPLGGAETTEPAGGVTGVEAAAEELDSGGLLERAAGRAGAATTRQARQRLRPGDAGYQAAVARVVQGRQSAAAENDRPARGNWAGPSERLQAAAPRNLGPQLASAAGGVGPAEGPILCRGIAVDRSIDLPDALQVLQLHFEALLALHAVMTTRGRERHEMSALVRHVEQHSGRRCTARHVQHVAGVFPEAVSIREATYARLPGEGGPPKVYVEVRDPASAVGTPHRAATLSGTALETMRAEMRARLVRHVAESVLGGAGEVQLCELQAKHRHTSPLQAWPEWDDLSTVAALPVGGPALSATGRRSSRASLPMARLATSDSLAENGRRWSLHLSVTGAGAPATPSASAPASDVAVAGGTAQTSTGPAGGAWGKAADQAGAARGLLDRGHGVAEAAGAWETPSSHRLPAPRPSTSGCEGTRGAAGGGRKSLATAGMSEGMAAGTPPTRVHVGQGFVVSQDALEKLEAVERNWAAENDPAEVVRRERRRQLEMAAKSLEYVKDLFWGRGLHAMRRSEVESVVLAQHGHRAAISAEDSRRQVDLLVEALPRVLRVEQSGKLGDAVLRINKRAFYELDARAALDAWVRDQLQQTRAV